MTVRDDATAALSLLGLSSPLEELVRATEATLQLVRERWPAVQAAALDNPFDALTPIWNVTFYEIPPLPDRMAVIAVVDAGLAHVQVRGGFGGPGKTVASLAWSLIREILHVIASRELLVLMGQEKLVDHLFKRMQRSLERAIADPRKSWRPSMKVSNFAYEQLMKTVVLPAATVS